MREEMAIPFDNDRARSVDLGPPIVNNLDNLDPVVARSPIAIGSPDRHGHDHTHCNHQQPAKKSSVVSLYEVLSENRGPGVPGQVE